MAGVFAVAVLLAPGFVVLAAAGLVFVAPACAAGAAEALAGASACEAAVAVDFVAGVVADGFGLVVEAAGFVSGVVLAAGFADVEVAEESCAALEAGTC